MNPGHCITSSVSFADSDEFSLFISPTPGASSNKFQLRINSELMELTSPTQSRKVTFDQKTFGSTNLKPHYIQMCIEPDPSGTQAVGVSASVLESAVKAANFTKLIAGPVYSDSPSFLARYTAFTLGSIKNAQVPMKVTATDAPAYYFGVGAARNNRADVFVQWTRSCGFIRAEPGELSDEQEAKSKADLSAVQRAASRDFSNYTNATEERNRKQGKKTTPTPTPAPSGFY
jgi:hypothetical protein